MSGKSIHSMSDALSWLPELTVDDSLSSAISHGNPIKFPDISEELKNAEAIKIKSHDNRLLSIGHYLSEKDIIKMDIVFT